MGEFFKQLLSQLATIWSKLSLQQRVIISSLFVFMTISLLTLVVWSSSGSFGSDRMRRMYTGLGIEDLSEITGALSAQNYRYEIRDNGTSLFVESDNYFEAKMLLAREGLPSGRGVGYELFDKVNFGMTDFQQNIKAQRALEGELTRTITSLREIRDARVHLVFQKSSLFLEEASDAKATVVLDVRGPSGLTQQQIQGISFLVASSVEGLRTENISIVDNSGRLLSSPYRDNQTAFLSSRNLEIRETIENRLTQRVENFLTGILGIGKVRVTLNADLDFDKIERSMEIFDPESRVVRSEERSQIEVSNAPDGDHRNRSSVSNYEINKTIEHITKEVGTINKLSIAVAVDGIMERNDAGEQIYRDRTAEELARIESMVKNSVGFDVARGDQISVVSFQFNDEFARVIEESRLKTEEENRLQMIVSLIVLALIIIISTVIVRKLGRSMADAMNPPIPEVDLPSSLEEEEDVIELPPNVARSNELLEKVEIMAENDPTNVSKIIRDWLNEPIKKTS